MTNSIQALAEIAHDWAIRCFGYDHVSNHKVRALRHAEEAVEIAHMEGVTREDINKMIDIIFSRPAGEAYQEVGGSILTLAVYCVSKGIYLDHAMIMELRRVLSKDPVIFTARNAEKVNPDHG